MGSPAIFKGSRTKLLTANGIETKDNQFLDYDGELELCRQSLLSFTDGSYSAATRPTGSFTAGAAGLVTSSATPFIGKKFAVTLTKTGACQGAASIQEYDLPTGLRAKVLCLKVDYRVASGTFNAGSSSADSDLIFYIEEFDGTNWKKKEPSTFKLFSNSSTIADQYSGYFQTDADTTKVRVIAFIATTGNNNFSLVCSFSLGVTKYVYGTPITDWVEYTPQLLGSVTNPTIGTGGFVRGRWRRVGDSIDIQATAYRGTSGGTAGSGYYYLTLPSGMVGDSQKIVVRANVGTGYVLDGLVSNYTGVAFLTSDFSKLSVQLDQYGDVLSNTIPSSNWWTSAGDNSFEIRASVPIQGWSSSVKMSDGYDGREVVFIGGVTTQTIATGTVEVPKILTPPVARDTCACYNPSTGVFKVPSSGFYRISGRIGYSLDSSYFFRLGYSINSTSSFTKFSGQVNSLNVNAFVFNSIDDVVYLTAGDEIRFGVSHNNPTNIQAPSDSRLQAFSIERISSPQTIAMGEVVAARYSTASGQSISANTYTTVNFNIKEYDTHNAVTTGTNWVFTAPVAGIYNVSFRLLYNLFSVSPPAEMPTALYENNNYFCEIGRVIIPTGGNVFPSMGGSVDIQLNAGDTISIKAGNVTGAARNLYTDSALVWVAIHKIS